jgi:CBS domain containing-hemolysin-like protein
MSSRKVKEVMIPLTEYATISQEATLYQAVLALEETYAHTDQQKHKHRALLVYDGDKRIVGKLSHLSILRALDPKFQDVGDVNMLTRFGFGPAFLRNITRDFELLQKPLDDICKKAAKITVRKIMQIPTKEEYIEQEASINEGIHLLAIGRFQSLLVKQGEEVVGVLRLSDAYHIILEMMKKCELPE